MINKEEVGKVTKWSSQGEETFKCLFLRVHSDKNSV